MSRKHLMLGLSLLTLAACSKDGTGPDGTDISFAVVSGENQSIVAGSAATQPVVLAVTDKRGAPKAGVSLHWTASGVLPADTTLVSDANGSIRVSLRADTAAGLRSASVVRSGSTLTPRTIAFTVVAGSATRVVGGADTTRLTIDATPYGPLFVDRFGNAIDRGAAYTIADTSIVSAATGRLAPQRSGATRVTARLDNVSFTTVLSVIGWKQISAGWQSACGVTSEGRLYCWGAVTDSILGRPAANQCDGGSAMVACTLSPNAVLPNLRFQSVSLSIYHACALDAQGQAWCWGRNDFGYLGDGTTTPRTTPRPVAGGYRFTSIATGKYFSCGQVAAGQIYCWGWRAVGILGDGVVRVDTLTTPTLTAGPAGSKLIAGDDAICGMVGSVPQCWGMVYTHSEGSWALGTGQPTPTRWGAPYTYSDFALGYGMTYCGVSSQQVYCWGHNDEGQLGTGNTDPSTTPTAVLGGFRAKSVAVGSSFTCALTTDGDPWCWGANDFNSLGRTTTETCRVEHYKCSPTPAPVDNAAGHNLVHLTTGANFAIAINDRGQAFGWGFGLYGSLAQGRSVYTSGFVPVPVPVPGGASTAATASHATITASLMRASVSASDPTLTTRVTVERGKRPTVMSRYQP